MEALTVSALLDLQHTVAASLFAAKQYPWEVLDEIGDFLRALGEKLDPAVFEERLPGVWVARDAVVAPTAYLAAPCIIDRQAEIRHCAFIRGNALVGKQAVVGNSTELKNVLLFDRVQVPHYNYVGDSVLGYHAHMGAGAVTSNVKGDGSPVTVHAEGETLPTGRKKFGAILGDGAEIGCNAVLNPGTVIGRGTRVYPLSMVRGFVPSGRIWKTGGEIAVLR